MLRSAAPVVTLQKPDLQNNWKVPDLSCNRLETLLNLRQSADFNRPKACYFLRTAKNSQLSG
jgi:hypothetical protein